LASLSDSADAPLTIRFEQSFEATFARKETSSNGLEQDGDLLNALRSAVFVGDVRVQHGRDRIQCARMEMDFAPDPTGRPQPAQARMFKDVRVSQGARMIAAREQLLTLFRVIEREKPPFDLAQARARAAARGLDPDQQDWAARQ